MKKRILFVDDERMVLDGLQRMLRPMREKWDMAFASSGKEALELMSQAPFDVVVSDMRMPEMNGAQLLAEVLQRYPHTVRLILSGHLSKRRHDQLVLAGLYRYEHIGGHHLPVP